MHTQKNKIILAGGVILALLLLSFLIYLIFVSTIDNSNEANASAVSLTNSQEQSSVDDTLNPTEESDPSATFQRTAVLGECSIPSELLGKYKDTTVPFEYEIKSSYSSRKEVLEELYTLSKCFDQYTGNIDIDNYKFNGSDSAVNKHDQVMTTLEEELKKFPMSDEDEIRQRRINKFYSYHATLKGIYETKEMQFKATGEENYKRQYEEDKALYDEEEIVRKDYESGKITIEEALIRIGLPEYANGTEKLF